MSIAPASRPAGSAKVDWLSQIKKPKGRPTAAVIHGAPGIGKTSFAANAPSPVFITGQLDQGVETLVASGQIPEVSVMPPCRSWADVLGQVDSLAQGEHDRKTVVVDNLGDIEILCHEEVCRRDFKGDFGKEGFQSYMAGYRVSAGDFRQFLMALDRCRDIGMSTIIIAHTKTVEVKNPLSANFDKYAPDVAKETWSVVEKWADLVLFCNKQSVVVGTNREETKKGKARDGDRVMFTSNSSAYAAKNRHNLPEEIPMGDSGAEAWANLINAIKEGRNSNG